MRRTITVLLIVLILSVFLLTPVYAAGKIEITRQPQNMTFPENASAYWSVEATGEDLVYEWFIIYNGVAYNTIKSYVENHPWQEGVVGDGYGHNDIGNGFFINGIGSSLDGAEIYCVVSNKTSSVTSQRARISVGNKKSPPQLTVPASVTIEKGKILKLYCEATTSETDAVKSYLWYETTTGKLKDIVAIGAKEGYSEEDPILVCDTGKPGTRYYVCYVETKFGGKAYSSVIPVTVIEKAVSPDRSLTTSATEHTVTSSQTTSSDSIKDPESDVSKLPEISSTEVSSEESSQLPEDNADETFSSPLMIVLIVAGGTVVIAGGITGFIIARKKKKQ